jgi:Fructose-1,6-bisphosphatase
MASEEEPGIIQIPDNFKCGKYCLLFDPLDGSSNIDVNVPVGTIFSVVQKITRGRHGEMEDMLQPGRARWRGLRDLRLEHDARVHDGERRPRLHAGSVHR